MAGINNGRASRGWIGEEGVGLIESNKSVDRRVAEDNSETGGWRRG